MEIKRIHRNELDAYLKRILSIEQLVQVHPWTEKNILESIADNYRFYVLLDNDNVAGYAVYDFVLDESTLQNISISAEYQGKGYGKKLLLESIKQLKEELKIVKVMLEVRISNNKAINLYKSVGFEEDMIRKNYYPMPDGSREYVVLMSLSFS